MNIRITDVTIYTPDKNIQGDICISGSRIAAVGNTPADMVFDEVISG